MLVGMIFVVKEYTKENVILASTNIPAVTTKLSLCYLLWIQTKGS